MKQVLISFIAAAVTCSVQPAFAAEPTPEQKKAVKKSTKQSKQAKKTEGNEPEIAGATATEYTCSQGKKVTIYTNPQNEQQQHMRWEKKLHPMTNVETESGAVRLESQAANLTWISVPAKSMLLDAKKGLRLATDCLRPDQSEQK